MLVELQPLGKVFGLPTSPDELHSGEELLVAIALLPLPQLQHEEEAETGLHHHPVYRQVDVCGQEHNDLHCLNGTVWYSRIKPSFGETRNIIVPDIPLETDAGSEVVQFIVQCLYTGKQNANRKPIWPGLQPVLNLSMSTASVFPPMLR